MRLAVRPEFDGKVVKGREYMLVDDALGMGGTVSELRYYIENNDGKVVAVSALTSGIFGSKLSITRETVAKLKSKFGRKNLMIFFMSTTQQEALKHSQTKKDDTSSNSLRLTPAEIKFLRKHGKQISAQARGRFKHLFQD